MIARTCRVVALVAPPKERCLVLVVSNGGDLGKAVCSKLTTKDDLRFSATLKALA